ncbi:flagellar type III secretion system pore protein FliP [Caulobacter sp. DWR1-3-2b1]|uniref:flagellar type III secretion system pore protein FliP n=1 Tax=Caulobacter sp. DWR1-3-2b1 TaxID=2804670 RepID=UPI003CFB9BEE
MISVLSRAALISLLLLLCGGAPALAAVGAAVAQPVVAAVEPRIEPTTVEPTTVAPAAAAPKTITPRPFREAATATPRATSVEKTKTADVIRIAVVLTLAGMVPIIAICMTPFVRIIVVLSMIRHAFGMPETPPSQVLVSLALFLTAFTMMPTFTQVNDNALRPFLDGAISVERAMDEGAEPMRRFMLRQVRDKDLQAVYVMAKKPLPASAQEVGLMELTSAFMLNELRVAFKIGFVILLPFLLIDLVVSGILLSLGMLMVPPSTLALPIKILMFVLIDGWTLVLEGVVGSFR